MNLKNLEPGTKLMWDAPELYNGYAKEFYNRDDHRVIYPAIVTNKTTKNELLGTHIASKKSKHWMGDKQEYLRLPTEEELNTLEWPEWDIE